MMLYYHVGKIKGSATSCRILRLSSGRNYDRPDVPWIYKKPHFCWCLLDPLIFNNTEPGNMHIYMS